MHRSNLTHTSGVLTQYTFKRSLVLLLAATALNLAISHVSCAKPLAAFENEAQLQKAMKDAVQAVNSARKLRRDKSLAESASGNIMQPMQAVPAPAAPVSMAKESASQDKAEFAAPAADSVTNNQTQGVDEGGIIKVHGDHLVILRRGRLFTVDIQGKNLQPVHAINAYGPGNIGSGAWYDEMLIQGDTVVVIGYNYQRGGTEIGLFDIANNGRLSHRDTYHLRSNDYYSSRNYASRLIGNKLIFYTPLSVNMFAADPTQSFPAVRRYKPNADQASFTRIAPARKIYRTDEMLDPYNTTMHSVTQCDLSTQPMQCDAIAVMGGAGSVFYVSQDAVYVWASQNNAAARAGQYGNMMQSVLIRLPLNGDVPSALKTTGMPIDQFSFLETDQQLHVMLRANGRGQSMWGAENANSSNYALMTVPLNQFVQEATVPPRAYTTLPSPGQGQIQNRFIGQYLLYGAGSAPRWNNNVQTNSWQKIYTLRYKKPGNVMPLDLGHAVERIEALGDNAVIVGTRQATYRSSNQPNGKSYSEECPNPDDDDTNEEMVNSGQAWQGANRCGARTTADLVFSGIALPAASFAAGWFDRAPSRVSQWVQRNASQGESRSHGFFYKQESDASGLLGLPIRLNGGTSKQLTEPSSAVVFVRNQNLKFSALGRLQAKANGAINDQCQASCADWYGNSRPLFIRGRVFALMGYELVEGVISRQNGANSTPQGRRTSPNVNAGWGMPATTNGSGWTYSDDQPRDVARTEPADRSERIVEVQRINFAPRARWFQ